MNVLKVDTLNEMNLLQNHLEDEIIYIENEQKYFKWNGTEYEEFHFNTNSNINLYDLNQQVISQQEPMTIEEIQGRVSLFNKFYYKFKQKHYMLLCKEKSSYTIFEEYPLKAALHDFATEVIELITEYGDVYDINMNDDESAMEIWIKDKEDELAHVYYLFPYDTGVVYYG